MAHLLLGSGTAFDLYLKGLVGFLQLGGARRHLCRYLSVRVLQHLLGTFQFGDVNRHPPAGH